MDAPHRCHPQLRRKRSCQRTTHHEPDIFPAQRAYESRTQVLTAFGIGKSFHTLIVKSLCSSSILCQADCHFLNIDTAHPLVS
jgi:hypothetical protein